MSPGPLRRLLGALGLAALAPVALRVVDGSMAPVDAALRAVATLVVVMVLGRLTGTWLARIAHAYDRQGPPRREESVAGPAPGGADLV